MVRMLYIFADHYIPVYFEVYVYIYVSGTRYLISLILLVVFSWLMKKYELLFSKGEEALVSLVCLFSSEF